MSGLSASVRLPRGAGVSPARPALRTPGGILQRQCACGTHTVGGGNCSSCKGKDHAADAVAPPIVHETLRAPGRPLDADTRALMEPRLGRDLSQVRLHTDGTAARSARAVNAQAYTVAPHVVFGADRYAPHTAPGLQLLAHELTHVAQQDASPAAGQDLRVDPPGSAAETEADRISQDLAAPAPAVRQRGPGAVLSRSLEWAVGGGLGGGAALGVGLGAGLGKVSKGAGIAGGILGGLAGFIGGAVLGDYLSTDRRRLSADERRYAHDIYQDSLDYDAIEITKNSTLARGTSRTYENTINLDTRWFKPGSMELTDRGQETLVHEMGHVWQYQHGGTTYIGSSLLAQAIAGDRGTRDLAYNWRNAVENHIPWEKWNAEQQAQCISDYNEAKHRIDAGNGRHLDVECPITNPKCAPPAGWPQYDDYRTVTLAEGYIDLVRHGKGAVGSEPEAAAGAGAP